MDHFNDDMDLSNKSIDKKKILSIVLNEKKKILAIIVCSTSLALGLTFVVPKKYESTTLVQTRKANYSGAVDMASAVGLSGFGGSSNPAPNYIELMKTRTVIEPIIENMSWENEDDKPAVDKFVQKYLTIENTKQTNLIKVTAIGKTPEEAQNISESVVNNFLSLQTDKSRQTQNLLFQFLSDRVAEAQKEAEEAQFKFAEYQKENGIYSPEQQSKLIVSRMDAFDDLIGHLETQIAANQARVDVVNAQLSGFNQKSLQFNINDNANVLNLRNILVQKQVDLVTLQDKYTNNHPAVIQQKNEINELKKQLSNEVSAVVRSNVTSLNPAHAKLIEDKAKAESEIEVAKASEKEVEVLKENKKKAIEDFPQKVQEYHQLELNKGLKKKIYENLVTFLENTKYDAAKESMDIQIIDNANLPEEDKPISPKKSVYGLAGMAVGIVLSFLYIFNIYRKDENNN